MGFRAHCADDDPCVPFVGRIRDAMGRKGQRCPTGAFRNRATGERRDQVRAIDLVSRGVLHVLLCIVRLLHSAKRFL